MKLSVIIPVFNEESTVEELVRSVQAAPFDKEILIVDDGSTDRTPEILEPLALEEQTRVFRLEKNSGKGAAVRTGIREAIGDFILIQDADLEYDPAEYPKLLQPLLDGKADVVFGSRFIGSESHRVLYFLHYVGNRFLTILSNSLTDLNLTDMETCFKVFRREIIQGFALRENRFGLEPELTARVAAAGCRVYEVGISYSGRTYAEGKKITWKDGIRAIFCILRYNLLP